MIKPKIVYKFTTQCPEKPYAEDLISGRSVRIGTLSEFRGSGAGSLDALLNSLSNRGNPAAAAIAKEFYESVGEKPKAVAKAEGINDAWEGRTGIRASADDMQKNALAQALAQQFMGHFAAGTWRDNVFIENVPNRFIYCASNDLSDKTIDRMKRDSELYATAPYNVAVPIFDVVRFGERLAHALAVYLGRNGMRLFRGLVTYQEVDQGLPEAADLNANPFIKRPFFQSQNEYRWLFDTHIPDGQQAVLIPLLQSMKDCCGDAIKI